MTISHYWIPLIIWGISKIIKSFVDGEFILFDEAGLNSGYDIIHMFVEIIVGIIYVFWGLQWLWFNVHIF